MENTTVSLYANVKEQELPRISDLNFRHFVVSKKSGTLFVSARESNSRIRNFIIDETGVKLQSGSKFTDLSDELSSQIRIRVNLFFHKVPVYQVSDLPNF